MRDALPSTATTAARAERVVAEREVGAAMWAGPVAAWGSAGLSPPALACALVYCNGEVQIVPPGDGRAVAQAMASGHGLAAVFSSSLLPWRRAPRQASGRGLVDDALQSAWARPGRYVVSPDARRSWSERLARLEVELQTPAPASAQAADALLKLLAIDAARLAWAAPAAEPTQIVAEAAAVIDQRFRSPLSLTDVATALSVSPSHLTRLVRRATGRSVGEWIRDRRMEEARHLLRDTEAPVDAVAGRVGYRDVAHFRRHFLRVHETTPARWRERARPDLGARVR